MQAGPSQREDSSLLNVKELRRPSSPKGSMNTPKEVSDAYANNARRWTPSRSSPPDGYARFGLGTLRHGERSVVPFIKFRCVGVRCL